MWIMQNTQVIITHCEPHLISLAFFVSALASSAEYDNLKGRLTQSVACNDKIGTNTSQTGNDITVIFSKVT